MKPLLTIVLLFLATSILAAEAPVRHDWPQFLGPTANGVSRETGLNLTWPTSGPPLLWERTLGSSYASPVVSDEQCIVFHRLLDQEIVTALDSKTGKELWKSSYPTHYRDRYGYSNGPRAAPLVHSNQVYTIGAEGVLSRFSLKDGTLKWQRKLNEEFSVEQNFFGVGAAPVISETRLLLNIGAVSAQKKMGVVALDIDTGKTVWSASDHLASYSTPTVTTYNGKEVAVFLTRRGVLILQCEDGKILYESKFRSTKTESVNASSPVVFGKQVLVSATYGTGCMLISLDGDRITETWRKEDALQSHWATSIYSDGSIYGMHGRHESESVFRCLNALTGEIKWTSGRGLGRSSFLMAQGHLIVLGERGDLALIRVSDTQYDERFRLRVLDYPSWTPPILAQGLLYLRSETQLKCYDLTPAR